MKLALVGPASPRELSDLFDVRSRDSALVVPGYRATSVHSLARALREAGHDLEIVTGAFDVQEQLTFTGDGIRMHVSPFRARARHRAKDLYAHERRLLSDVLARLEVEVVNAHWTYEFAVAALQQPKAPVIVTAHDQPLIVLKHSRDAYRAMRCLVAAEVWRRNPAMTAVSPYLAESWERNLRYRRPVQVIPNVLPDLPRAPASSHHRPPTYLCVADAGPRKNVRTLVQAFRRVRVAIPEATLLIVGPGLGPDDATPRVLQQAELLQGVEFLGVLSRDQLVVAYGNATHFVHPSLEETFGYTVVEAMQASLPVIAGRESGAIPWLLGRGTAGLLCDVTDHRALAEAMVYLAENPQRSRVLVAGAEARLRDELSNERTVAAYVDAFRRVAEGDS